MKREDTRALRAKVADYIRRHPAKPFREISEELGISVPSLSEIARQHGINRGAASRLRPTPELLERLGA
jgi:DNA-binding Lrp family transcriptional regulator